MIEKIKSEVSEKVQKGRNRLKIAKDWIMSRLRKYKKRLIGLIVILSSLLLVGLLALYSYKSVDSLSQGALINYTQGAIVDSLIKNQYTYAGLNSYYETFPNNNFLITFDSNQPETFRNFPSILARVEEGIRLQISVKIGLKLDINSIAKFMNQYGFTRNSKGQEKWCIYIKQKIRNVVVQAVSSLKFYDLNNKILLNLLNIKLAFLYTTSEYNFIFNMKAVNLNIEYPSSLTNDHTLGIILAENQFTKNQLQFQYQSLLNNLATYRNSIANYTSTWSTLRSETQNRQLAVNFNNLNWTVGLQTYNSSVLNSSLVQRYMDVYFNTLYNVTYRINQLNDFKI